MLLCSSVSFNRYDIKSSLGIMIWIECDRILFCYIIQQTLTLTTRKPFEKVLLKLVLPNYSMLPPPGELAGCRLLSEIGEDGFLREQCMRSHGDMLDHRANQIV